MMGPSAASPLRLAILFFALLALVASVGGGLFRIGWNLPLRLHELPGIHGPLVVCGFLGGLFALDRSMALKRAWGDPIVLVILAGTFLLAWKPVGPLPPAIVLAGSAGFVAMCYVVYRAQPHLHNAMFFLGSFHWLIGVAVWFRLWPVFNVYVWWSGFILFTLVGQRMELAHRANRAGLPFYLLKIFLGVVVTGETAMAVGHMLRPDDAMYLSENAIIDPRLTWGMRIAGAGFLGVAAWLLRYDAAWTLLRSRGLASYAALCAISGYAWLGLSGLLSLAFAGTVSGHRYDAMIHAFYIGFVFFIIFGHGFIMAMSALGLRVDYTPLLFVPFILLHGSLLLRMAGDFSRTLTMVKWGGLFNAVSIALFLVLIVRGLYRARLRESLAG